MRKEGPLLAAALVAVSCSTEAPPTAASTEAQAAPSAAATSPGTVAVQGETQGLRAQVRLTDADARAIALRRIAGGRIVQAKYEEEGGTPLFTYELRVAGRSGTVELEIDARTGAVLSEEREADDPEDDPVGRDDVGGR